MKTTFKFVWMLLAGCGGDSDLEDAPPVVEHYAEFVHASYDDALQGAQDLKLAVDAFVASPSQSTLDAAREAWLAAREPYGQTESYRFYDGPIDNPVDGPEGRINAWPLDEAYVDYVIGNAQAGIINNPIEFPTLSKELLAEKNEKGAEENISTGFHAIEFLLYGQDTSVDGPGDRPFTDYTTAPNFDRRGTYLSLVSELLVDDLQFVADAWEPGSSYRVDFTGVDAREALRRMVQGMGALSGAELSGERMGTALDNRDQEDEHSCFSDNTHRDLRANAIAIENVYLGRYGTLTGPSLSDLVVARDADLDARMRTQLAATIAAIEAIPTPFDQALMNDAGRAKIETAIDLLKMQTATTVEVATLLGVTINLE